MGEPGCAGGPIAARGTSSRSIRELWRTADRRSGTGGPGGAYAAAGERKRARELLLRAIRTARQSELPEQSAAAASLAELYWSLATGCARLGDRRQAVEMVRSAVKAGWQDRKWMEKDPSCDWSERMRSSGDWWNQSARHPGCTLWRRRHWANLAVPSSGRDNIRRVVMRHSRFLFQALACILFALDAGAAASRIISRSRPSFTRTALLSSTG